MLGLSLPYDDNPSWQEHIHRWGSLSLPRSHKVWTGSRFVQVNQPLLVGMPCRPPAQAHENGYQCSVNIYIFQAGECLAWHTNLRSILNFKAEIGRRTARQTPSDIF
jgi:hypothetical protein